MTRDLLFWAQALDNASPDHLARGGQDLPIEDSGGRQDVVSRVSAVVKTGDKVFSEAGVNLTGDGNRFVVEVTSVQRDHAGRAAPIICFGEYASPIEDSLWVSVAAGVEDFARRIGRDVAPERVVATRRAFDQLKKKRRGGSSFASARWAWLSFWWSPWFGRSHHGAREQVGCAFRRSYEQCYSADDRHIRCSPTSTG
ncbi:MAG: hypothetical protein ABI548_18205 [Polyangiaceae bacterium]